MTPQLRLERAIERYHRLQKIAVDLGVELRDATQDVREARNAVLESEAREHQSARPCGCDPGANWTCEAHQDQVVPR